MAVLTACRVSAGAAAPVGGGGGDVCSPPGGRMRAISSPSGTAPAPGSTWRSQGTTNPAAAQPISAQRGRGGKGWPPNLDGQDARELGLKIDQKIIEFDFAQRVALLHVVTLRLRRNQGEGQSRMSKGGGAAGRIARYLLRGLLSTLTHSTMVPLLPSAGIFTLVLSMATGTAPTSRPAPIRAAAAPWRPPRRRNARIRPDPAAGPSRDPPKLGFKRGNPTIGRKHEGWTPLLGRAAAAAAAAGPGVPSVGFPRPSTRRREACEALEQEVARCSCQGEVLLLVPPGYCSPSHCPSWLLNPALCALPAAVTRARASANQWTSPNQSRPHRLRLPTVPGTRRRWARTG